MIALFSSYACYKHYLSSAKIIPRVSLILPKHDLIAPKDNATVRDGHVSSWDVLPPSKPAKILYDSKSRPLIGTEDQLFPYLAYEFSKHLSYNDEILIVTYPNRKANFQLFNMISYLGLSDDVHLCFPKERSFINNLHSFLEEYNFVRPSSYLICRWKHLAKSLRCCKSLNEIAQAEFRFIISNPMSLTLINQTPSSCSINSVQLIYDILEANKVIDATKLNWLQRSYSTSYIRSMIDGFVTRGLIERTGANVCLSYLGKQIQRDCRLSSKSLCMGLYFTHKNWGSAIDKVQDEALRELKGLAHLYDSLPDKI